MQRNGKILKRKICLNPIVKKAFCEFMVSQGHMTLEKTKKFEYLPDLLLVNILDQIWI